MARFIAKVHSRRVPGDLEYTGVVYDTTKPKAEIRTGQVDQDFERVARTNPFETPDPAFQAARRLAQQFESRASQ